MSVIDFKAARDKITDRKEEREQVKQTLSSPMKTLYKNLYLQSFKEVGDSMINVISPEDLVGIFSEKEILELYKDYRERMYDTVLAMDYVIEKIEQEGD